MEAFIATITLFGGNFAPRGWSTCSGQILSIAQNTAVFSLLGTTYGGNGQTTFGLPDLRSRVPVGVGQGPGLSSYQLGEIGGVENVTLNQNTMPTHTHAVQGAVTATTTINALIAPTARVPSPSGNLLTAGYDPSTSSLMQNYAAPGAGTAATLAAEAATTTVTSTITNGLAGGNQPFDNRVPYLGINYIMCLQGIFPSRN